MAKGIIIELNDKLLYGHITADLTTGKNTSIFLPINEEKENAETPDYVGEFGAAWIEEENKEEE